MTSDPGTAPSPSVGASARGRVRRVRWGAVAGTVVLAYVLVFSVVLSQVSSRDRFNRWGAAMGSLGARLVLCVVVLATLFHTFDGLRRMLPDVVPALVDQDRRLRAAALFATWALALPCFAVLVWPWVSETTR
jgi:succinate dehydrogenase/fumarate reductase cytochrome b subunit